MLTLIQKFLFFLVNMISQVEIVSYKRVNISRIQHHCLSNIYAKLNCPS